VLLATLDASIALIAMPDIFRGIHLDPLAPANSAVAAIATPRSRRAPSGPPRRPSLR
jgi:hypothetical protein